MSTPPAPNPVQEAKPAEESIPAADADKAKKGSAPKKETAAIPPPPPLPPPRRKLKLSNTMKVALGTIVILVALLVLSGLHTRSATIQMTAVTDVVEVRLAERIGVKGLEVEDAAITGVTSIRLPTQFKQLDPTVPLEIGPAGQTKIFAPMTLEMGPPALLQVRRLGDQASSRQFLIRLSPVKETSMPSSITMILQAGQVVRQGEERVFEADQEALVELLAMGDLEANSPSMRTIRGESRRPRSRRSASLHLRVKRCQGSANPACRPPSFLSSSSRNSRSMSLGVRI